MHRIGSSERPDLALAVIVGAGGMGMAVARRLGQSHRLLLADRNEEHLKQQIAALIAEGHDATGLACDVSAPADIFTLAERARSLGPVRTLAYVVGLSPSAGDFRAIMAVNLAGAAAAAEAFAGVLAAGGCGIFISSSAAHMSAPPRELTTILDAPRSPELIAQLETSLGDNATPATAYALSKVGLNRMCRRLAAGWGKRRLRILSVSPGLIATPMGAKEFENSPAKHRLLAAIPLEREGTMLEIADLVEFLASPRASFITGTDILIDGGMIAGLGVGG